jgi:AcrR family transcriptional regulator
MSYVATGRYRGAPAEERRAERRERLLDTAFDLLGKGGWRGMTVRGVCEAARLNPRYFYESFADLDELVLAVFERVAAQTTERILDAFDAAADNAHAKAHATIEACVRYLTDDPRRARVMFLEALGNEALARRRLDAMHAMGQLLAAYARRFYGLPDDSDPVGDITAGLLVGGAAELIIAWLDGRLGVDREQLIEDLTELWVITGEGAVAIARHRAPGRDRRRSRTGAARR